MTDLRQDEDRALEEIFDDVDLDAEDVDPGCDGDTAYKVIGCLVRSGFDDDEVAKAFVIRPDALDLIPQLIIHCAKSMRRRQVRDEETRQRRARDAALNASSSATAQTPVSTPTSIPAASGTATRPTSQRKSIPASRILPISPAVAASWRLLANQSIDVPDADGQLHSVHWLDATVAQHRARAAWLRRQVTSTIRTAENHERAAADCEQAGVNTLRELLAGTGGSHAA